MQRVARVEDDDRLAGLWLRPGRDPIFYAPVNLADGASALCRVELIYVHRRRRVTHWVLYRHGGAVLEGELEPAAVASWQALAAVERTLEEHGIRLTAGARPWRLPTA